MPKPIQTPCGTATQHSAQFAAKRAKMHLALDSRPGLHRVTATRLAPASEPNTYQWRCEGLPGLAPELIIAPDSRAALTQYLTSPHGYSI